MDRRSLPLNALRTFDAAARHLNFTRAAEELGVTHGAVSRQITALEASLNTSLFVRDTPMRLTGEGRALYEGVSPALDAIAEAVDEARRVRPHSLVVVNAPPTFTMKWLIPRLSGFQRRFRDAEVRLSTGTSDPSQIKLGDAHIVIRRVSGGERNDGVAQPFLSGALVCVCAPELIEGSTLRELADLQRYRLIEAATNQTNWSDWFAVEGLPRPADIQFVKFEEMFYAVQAALDGLGMALVPLTLVADDLAAGRLVMPVRASGLKERDYCFVAAPANRRTSLAEAFCQWLLSEGEASNRLSVDVLASDRPIHAEPPGSS
jgi:LysR family glycine cleavage system transcriptional activator